MSGGSNDGEKQYKKFKVVCNANASMKQHYTDYSRTDLTNKQTTDLLIEQETAFKSVTLNIDPTVKYQLIAVIRGMYNLKIWCGGNLISARQLEQMYGS